jgi:Flp pilus assembly protein TadG
MLIRSRSRSANLPRKRSGSAVIETALLLPMLIMLAFGVVDYGYCIFLTNTFQGAATTGARVAVLDTSTNSDVTTAVSNMMTAAGISPSSYTVTLTPSTISGLSAGTSITVAVSGTWGNLGTKILPSSFGGMSNSKVVTGVSVMVKEQ